MTNLDNKDYSMIVRVLNFNVPSKSEHKRINKEAFIQATLGNPEFNNKLKLGQLPGLFTHSSRDSRRMNRSIPYVDNIIRDPDFCNFTAALDIDGDDVYAGINIIDYGKGLLLKEMIRNKPDPNSYPISVSMATRARVTPNEYIMREFLGVDFTQKPDLDAEIMSINFSEEDRIHRINTDLEIVSTCDSPRSLDTTFNKNFSAASINQYVRELSYEPHRVLWTRLDDVVSWCKQHKQEEITSKLNVLKSYIDGYIYQWILAEMNNPTSKFNIALGLRLNRYVANKNTVRDLQRTLTLVKGQLASRGVINNASQIKLNTSFNLMMQEIYQYINTRLAPNGKTFS